MTKKTIAAGLLALLVLVGAGCSDADVASENLSRAADQFEIARRIVFYNGITGEYMLSIEGLCSLGNWDAAGQLSVTCKTGPSAFKKHFLGLSDNVTYFVEQVDAESVSDHRYRMHEDDEYGNVIEQVLKTTLTEEQFEAVRKPAVGAI